MILVDTSVLIDFLKGSTNESTKKLDVAIASSIPFGIADVTYQEVLQGAADERNFKKLKLYLDTLLIYSPIYGRESYAEAARIYFNCRKRGYIVRSTVDCLIAEIAIEHQLKLLHSDRNFDHIATVIKRLNIL